MEYYLAKAAQVSVLDTPMQTEEETLMIESQPQDLFTK